MRIDHKAAGAGSVAGAHGSTMATGKGQPGCDGDGRWGETHHLPRSSRMAQTQDVLARADLYQWESSRDYNASPGLERIQAVLLAINSADDERYPPELGVLDREITRVQKGRVLLIPGSDETAGHGTTARAKFWKKELAELLQSAPRRAQ
jgi:hypothetical protein